VNQIGSDQKEIHARMINSDYTGLHKTFVISLNFTLKKTFENELREMHHMKAFIINPLTF